MQKILDLTEKLISIRSISGNPKGLEAALELALSELTGFTIENFERNGIRSALIYAASERPKCFKVLFSGHLDVVPGKEEQYTPRREGDRLYAIGSMDMKANVACLITAFKQVARSVSYPLGLQLVTDEEVGGFDGTKYQVEQGVRADFVIAGEPTNFDIVHQAKGVLNARITARGTTAHGAYPWRGDNAIWKMQQFLGVLLEKFPIPDKQKWITTLNLSRISTSNTAFNKIPDDCCIDLDIRFVPEDSETAVSALKELMPVGFEIEVLCKEAALSTDSEHACIKLLKEIADSKTAGNIAIRGAQGTSDARFFSQVGCPGVEFGPIGGDIGSDTEWVSVASLEQYTQILIEFLIRQS